MPPSFIKDDPRFQDSLSQSVLSGGPMATQPGTSNPSTNAFGLNAGAPSGFTMPNRPAIAPQSSPGAGAGPQAPNRPPFQAMANNFVNRTQTTDPFAAVPLNPAFAYGLPGGPTDATVNPPVAPTPAPAPATPAIPEGHPGNPWFAPGYPESLRENAIRSGNPLADPAYTRWEPWMGTGEQFGTSIPDQWKDHRYYTFRGDQMYDRQDQGD